MILLTKEEIKYEIEYVLKNNDLPVETLIAPMVESACQSQLKKVVEWLDYYLNDMEPATDETHTRFDMPTEKWEALKKEVGIDGEKE